MTQAEIASLESALRKARRDVFSDDATVADEASREIDRCKAALAPVWRARSDEVTHRRDQRFLYLTD